MRGLDFDGCASCLSDGIKWLSSHHHNITRKPFKTVEIKVRMDCEGCERKVKKSVKGMKGVTRVETDPKFHKLTVMGYVDPNKVLNRVRHHTGKKAELWPYVPYDAVEHLVHPYAPGVYDKKAPPGYVRNPHLTHPTNLDESALQSPTELKYSTAFSDENPNACVIM